MDGPVSDSAVQDPALEESRAMNISELEKSYQKLHERLLRGELDEDEFKAQVEQLRFKDNRGDEWKIGWYTGKWYRYDEGQWVQGTPDDQPALGAPPPEASAPPLAEDRQKKRSLTPCLVVSLVALLLVASIALIIGWNYGWWSPAEEDATAVAEINDTDTPAPPTDTPSPTEPPRASPTNVPTTSASPTGASLATSAPSHTPSPTATRRQPTTTPTVTRTGTRRPTSTVNPSQTPTAAATSRPFPTTAPSLAGQIYFPVYDSDPERQTFDIYVIQLASGKRNVVVGQASQPALSPDGTRLVYRSWDIGQRGILVLDFSAGNTWPWISFHEAEHPNWSPDGQNIVLSSQQESDREWRLYRTWGLEIDRVRREGGDIFGRVPTWSADGRIIYWECPLDKCGLYAIHTDGTNLTQLTIHENDTAPAASPDGSQIAYMSDSSGNWEIYVVSADAPPAQTGQEAWRLTRHAARDGLPTWSPDGRWLAFVSDRGGAWAVWAIRPDGSNLQKLFDLEGTLDGKVTQVPPTEQHGWTWESLAWGQ
jgi:Tol biopolymer transport system component